jgi:hypothetical protein
MVAQHEQLGAAGGLQQGLRGVTAPSIRHVRTSSSHLVSRLRAVADRPTSLPAWRVAT